jgi:ribosomal protein S18 acetylase RimI-like enzyme
MVHPKYRGNSLQLTLLDLRIDIARNRGKRYIVTVVAVDNIYSLKNIESLGFKLKSQKTNEFGILRNIFVKDLVEDMVCESVVTA